MYFVTCSRSSAAGDAASAYVARETAVSLSPPPHRVPPRPSNERRKRKESVAALVDDDDDFVDVSQRPSGGSSKTNRVAVRKIKKSKSSFSGHQNSEDVQNPSKRKNPNYMSAPNKVFEAIKSLKDAQKDKIRDYPFGPLLDLKLKGLENTKLLVYLMDSLDLDTLTLDIGNGKRLKISKHSIQCVLGLPNKGKRIVAPDKHKQKEALSNLKRKLGIEHGVDVKVQDLINWIKKGGTDPFSIRCFIMILLGNLLVPRTSDYITGKEAALTEDMETLSSVNCASVIYDDIAIAARLWHSKKACTNPSMHACLMFLLSSLNCEELHPGQVYDSSMAAKYLYDHLNGVEPNQIKLILWTYHHNNHFSVYRVNLVNTRIHVLDSIDWRENGCSFEERNDPGGFRSIKRLSDAFQTVTDKQFKDFSEWPIWSKEVPRQLPLGNSCASFTMKFLRHYDGEESQL